MNKKIFNINCESMRKLGIDPLNGVDYLENKEATFINPVHVKALQILKEQPAVASS